ncbi:DUF2398 family protein [Streptomyces avidinii]
MRFRAMRRSLTRRLLDDPVLYYDELTDAELGYLTRQRGFLTARINELTGLVAEVRAEGIAMVDPEDDLTDVRMPESGTRGHVTLLLAEYLTAVGGVVVPMTDLERRVVELAAEHSGFWSKSAVSRGPRLTWPSRPLPGWPLSAWSPALLTGSCRARRSARYAVGETVVLEPRTAGTAQVPAQRKAYRP